MGGLDQIDQPIKDQWTYHAVADVILANSLIRSFPEVDPDRVGITGISWGGYLTCIAASLDDRFKFAVPVYGCGFLGDHSGWTGRFERMGQKKSRRWYKLWDPSAYFPMAKIPFLWVTGSNDKFYPMNALQKSYRSLTVPYALCIRLRMKHAHGGPGENPEEIYAMAESVFAGGLPLARITGSGRDNRNVWATAKSEVSIKKAELNYTSDVGPWEAREWETVAAKWDAREGKCSAILPEATSVYYFNLIDERGLVVSSEHEVITQPLGK